MRILFYVSVFLMLLNCTKTPPPPPTPPAPKPVAQVEKSIPSDFSCQQGSPSIVIFDQVENRLKYCADGQWLSVEKEIVEVEVIEKMDEIIEPTKEKVRVRKIRDVKGDTYWCRGNRHRGAYKCTLSH